MSEEQVNRFGKFNRKTWGLIGVIVTVMIALIVGISIYNTPANRLSRQLDLGNRYLEEQNYEQAIVEFDKAIAIDPMNVEAYLGKADAYIRMDDLQSALDVLQIGYDLTGDERLKEKLDELDKQPEAPQRLDVNDLPEDLSDFLLYFNSYRDKSGGMKYDCNNRNSEEFNIVERIIGQPSCVNKVLYPGFEETSAWSFETDDVSQWDPLGKWTYVEGYGRISRQYVDFVAANIFHIDNVLLDEVRETDIYYCYGDYYYYWFSGMGWMDPVITVTEAWTYDDCYYLKYTHSGDGYEDTKSHNAVLAWSETDGDGYWTMYSHDTGWDIGAARADAVNNDDGGWYEAYRNMAVGAGKSEFAYLFKYADEPIRYVVYDIDRNGIPELIATNGASAMGDTRGFIFTYKDKVIYAGNAGFRGIYFWCNGGEDRFPGIFTYSGNSGLFLGYCYTLNNGTVEETLVEQTEEYQLADGSWSFKDTRITDNDAMYQAYKSENEQYLEMLDMTEILEMGWDNFVSRYAASAKDGQLPDGTVLDSAEYFSVVLPDELSNKYDAEFNSFEGTVGYYFYEKGTDNCLFAIHYSTYPEDLLERDYFEQFGTITFDGYDEKYPIGISYFYNAITDVTDVKQDAGQIMDTIIGRNSRVDIE